MSSRHDILGGDDFIDSMRYGGYRSPAHALAELIDNAFEANASKIDVVCKDSINNTMTRRVEQLQHVAVIDNGDGMSKEVLWNSLRFGIGTRRARRGIGRFGMGLPYSSISQCRKVEVYTWQEPGKVMSTYLDLDEIKKHNMREVPEPKPAEIPDIFKSSSKILLNGSGTMVVWSQLDRCIWKKSSTLLTRSENLVGRIYRKFIDSGKLKIRLVPIDNQNKIGDTTYVRPNDPLYQMVKSSTPPPWDSKPMFALDEDVEGDESGHKEEIPVEGADGNSYSVVMRFAFAKSEARELVDGSQAGSQPHGQHANFNLGVSVVRGGREINMDQNLCQTYDPLERWWGAEVEFPPALDEFFGITNNKQEATNFSVMTKRYGVEIHDKPADVEELNDEDKIMATIVKRIQTRIRNMRTQIKKQGRGTKKGKEQRHDPFSEKVRQREQQGHSGITDEQIQAQTETQRIENIKPKLADVVPKEHIEEEAMDIVRKKIRIKFEKADWSNSQFFDVSLDGGVAIVKLNTNHPAYKNLLLLVEDVSDDIGQADALQRLKDAKLGLFLLLASWARLEDEEPNDNNRKILANSRFHWGEIMESFLNK